MPSTIPGTICCATVPGFPNYLIGENGSVWSNHPNRTTDGGQWVRLKGTINTTGYRVVAFYNDDRLTNPTFVHRLVLEAFVGPRPNGMQCRHLDGNRLNNRLENLCWGTPQENGADKTKHGRGHRNGNPRLTIQQVEEIRSLRNSGLSHAAIGRLYGVAGCNVTRILNGKRWGDKNA